MITTDGKLEAKAKAARGASRALRMLPTDIKNQSLLNIAQALDKNQRGVLAANTIDYQSAERNGLHEAMLDRLLLTPERLSAMASDIRNVVALPDPVGENFDMRTLPNQLQIGKRRVPLGVIGVVYESRPNVTVEISALCLKSGNAVMLRGGSEAVHSNVALTSLVQDAIATTGMPRNAVQLVESTDRALVKQMLKLDQYIDLIIPRGGAGLIQFVAQEATIPVVTGGIGVCHTYVDQDANVEKAAAIAYNAKVQRPTVCNALDTLLVHASIAPSYLPKLANWWTQAGVEMRCDSHALTILSNLEEANVVPARDEDWGHEFLSLVASVKVVESMEEAIEHIEQYGSGHSEAIITENDEAARRFLDEVDAAAVYVNASTRFTDGAQFGLGAEVAISTNKLHARGPMGLQELTSYKWTILGTGQVRA